MSNVPAENFVVCCLTPHFARPFPHLWKVSSYPWAPLNRIKFFNSKKIHCQLWNGIIVVISLKNFNRFSHCLSKISAVVTTCLLRILCCSSILQYIIFSLLMLHIRFDGWLFLDERDEPKVDYYVLWFALTSVVICINNFDLMQQRSFLHKHAWLLTWQRARDQWQRPWCIVIGTKLFSLKACLRLKW